MSYLAEIRQTEFESFKGVREALDMSDLLLSQVANMIRTVSFMVDDSNFSIDERRAVLQGAVALLTSVGPCFDATRAFCDAARDRCPSVAAMAENVAQRA